LSCAWRALRIRAQLAKIMTECKQFSIWPNGLEMTEHSFTWHRASLFYSYSCHTDWGMWRVFVSLHI